MSKSLCSCPKVVRGLKKTFLQYFFYENNVNVLKCTSCQLCLFILFETISNTYLLENVYDRFIFVSISQSLLIYIIIWNVNLSHKIRLSMNFIYIQPICFTWMRQVEIILRDPLKHQTGHVQSDVWHLIIADHCTATVPSLPRIEHSFCTTHTIIIYIHTINILCSTWTATI